MRGARTGGDGRFTRDAPGGPLLPHASVSPTARTSAIRARQRRRTLRLAVAGAAHAYDLARARRRQGGSDPLPAAGSSRRPDPAGRQAADPRGALAAAVRGSSSRSCRTDRRGRYRARYRFRFPGPAALPLPRRLRTEADYPFATGASPTVDCDRALTQTALTADRAPARLGEHLSAATVGRDPPLPACGPRVQCSVGDWVRRPARPAAKRERKADDARKRREAGPPALGPGDAAARPRSPRAPSAASAAPQVAISPLNGTPDASPYTQISFLGVPANEISSCPWWARAPARTPGKLRALRRAPPARASSRPPVHPGRDASRPRRVVGPQGPRSAVEHHLLHRAPRPLPAAARAARRR